MRRLWQLFSAKTSFFSAYIAEIKADILRAAVSEAWRSYRYIMEKQGLLSRNIQVTRACLKEFTMLDAFIGRQPIYDRNLGVFAYELLYRSGSENSANVFDGDKATSQVIINAFLEIGLDKIVGDYRAFINLTHDFVTGKHPLPYAPSQVILEILENINFEADVIEGITRLSDNGYLIAFDDLTPNDARLPMLKYADLVKVDLPTFSKEQLHEIQRLAAQHNVKLLAEKVETQDEFNFCKEHGFDYFQGYFFCKPNIIKANRAPANRMATMRILGQLQDPYANIKTLEELISHDITLSHKILRSINSSFYALPKTIESIHQAVVYLGNKAIKQLATLIILSGVDDKPHELMITALIRSKMCELIAMQTGVKDADGYSTCGLLSILDALMDKPMHEILAQLPLSEELNQALLQQSGRMGQVLKSVIAYERGQWETTSELELSPRELQRCYLDAIDWANTINKDFMSDTTRLTT